MKMFSSSDLIRLKGKQQRAVEILYVENGEADQAARELHVGPVGLRALIARARRKLASLGIVLPDRRSSVTIGSRPEFA